MSKSIDKKFRVCVIGAGAAGLCAARFLASDLHFYEFVVFERNSEVGGTWIYTDDTDNDEYGLPIHSSMYKNLRTNVPKEIMTFPDFPIMKGADNETCSCISHENVLNYLKEYANHFHLRPFIEFNTIVESVGREIASDNEKTTWKVVVKNLKSNKISNHQFDAVMVCNGHFSKPYIPEIPGIESFPGKILHSHSYRKPEDFSGHRVVILGANTSGVDISTEISEYASETFLSHNLERLACEIPTAIIQVSGVEKIEGNKIFFRCGKTVEADSFVFCTGYNYSIPFLEENCDITVNKKHVTPLYRHLINVNHPSMCFIGLGNVILPFIMFHVQVQYSLSILKGTTKLPSLQVMLDDVEIQKSAKKDFHKFNDKQWPYYDTLTKEANFEPIPTYYKNAFLIWKSLLTKYPILSKCCKFVVSDNTARLFKPCGTELVNTGCDVKDFNC